MNTQLVVRGHRWVSDSVVSVELETPDGEALPGWAPGSHVDLVLPDGVVRQYSLCGVPGGRSWRLGVLREQHSRGGSSYICDSLDAGALIEVRALRNNFPLIDAPGYCFIAGGIGITPLLPMMAEVHTRGTPFEVHYGGRSRSSMAFLDEVTPYGDAVSIVPEDEQGLLPIRELIDRLASGWAVYCCGPEPLIAAVEEACSSRTDLLLRLERFVPVVTKAAPDAADSYTVVLDRSRVELQVEAGTSLMDAIDAVGVTVSQECREGICGACETKVLDGEPDHRDSILTAAEKATCSTMFLCVSGSKSSRLVLDL